MRMCLGCRQRKAQSELNRLALKDGRIVLDPRRELPGRGVYVCSDEACIDKAWSVKALKRAFRKEVKIEDPQAIKEAVRASKNIW